jgi:hypothetical protein
MSQESFNQAPEKHISDDLNTETEPEQIKSAPKKSGWFKRGITIASTIAATSLGGLETKADETNPTDRTIDQKTAVEQVSQEEKSVEVDKTKLTVASLWSESALAKAKTELKELETKEDASAFFESTFKDFFFELKWPSEDKGRGNTRLTRNGTRDDFKFLFNNALEMSKIAENLLIRFDYTEIQKENVRSLIKPQLEQLKEHSSYQAQKKREMWEKYTK